MREKAIPALIIAVVAALLTIWFSLKKETINTQFTSSIFINITDMNPLDYHEKQYLLFGGNQFDGKLQSYIRKTLAAKDDLTADVNNVSEQAKEYYMDMVVIEVVSRFFFMYGDWWDVDVRSVRRGTSTSTEVSANKPAPPFSPIKWSDWLDSLDTNSTLHFLLREYSNDFWLQKMVVPPQTKVRLHSEQYLRTISFENKFANICITIRRGPGSRGLGDYQLLLGYDQKKNHSFWSEHFAITCHADIEKLRSGHPDMGRYVRWAKTMFSELEYRLDDRKRMDRALEFKNLLNLTR